MITIRPVRLESCLKASASELGKAIGPEETLARVKNTLDSQKREILRETRRIDTGRLGIPVFMSFCASEARQLLPTRKQMGKGPSPAQAEASAVMELMERHAFFSFWQRRENFVRSGWGNARKMFRENLISEEEIINSVNDSIDVMAAREILDLLEWQFYPATLLSEEEQIWLPVDWFRMLGEFNGSSAGNSPVESVLQGLCELVERHVSCLADQKRMQLATIDPASIKDPCLKDLVEKFKKAGIELILKDMSLGMPMATVAALAWDPTTFPQKSEIVFTAGTASSPKMAAIRAITEVAQLAGDFCSSSCYEASGLPKFSSLEEMAWLRAGPLRELEQLPSVENADMLKELTAILKKLAPVRVYSMDTSDPDLRIPAHWTIAPGLQFRERDQAQSLGLFTGRKLVENEEPSRINSGLETLARYYPNAHFLPFFKGLAILRHGSPEQALPFFLKALPLQPHADARAMTSFYAGYALGQQEKWDNAMPYLQEAFELCPQMSEYGNLAGVAFFKLGDYENAESLFDKVLAQNRGSAMDLANRGVCRKLLGKREEAARDLQNALELDPGLAFARKHLEELPD